MSCALALVAFLLLGGDDWAAAAALDDPERRAAAVTRLLEEADGPLEAAQLDVAFRIGAQEGNALRLENARRIQAALHGRVRQPWSAVNLALTLSRAGAYDEADAVLAEQASRMGREHAEWGLVVARRALVALGRGDERRALDLLGASLLAGSRDAAVVLARHHQLQGHREAARAGFRALVTGGGSGAWALRGWGLTLLDLEEPAPGR